MNRGELLELGKAGCTSFFRISTATALLIAYLYGWRFEGTAPGGWWLPHLPVVGLFVVAAAEWALRTPIRSPAATAPEPAPPPPATVSRQVASSHSPGLFTRGIDSAESALGTQPDQTIGKTGPLDR